MFKEENPVNQTKCPLCLREGAARFIGYKSKGKQGLFPERDYKTAYGVFRCELCDLVYGDDEREDFVFNEDDSLLQQTHTDVTVLKSEAAYTDVLDFLENKTTLRAGARVLDVGSGLGRVSYTLQKAGFDVYSIEPKKQLFDFAIRNGLTKKEKAINKPFELAEFAPESFDFIFFEPLNHMARPQEAIQKVLTWLKPGGYLHLQVVNNRWLYKQLLQMFYRITFRKHTVYTSLFREPFNLCEYSVKSFKVYCQQNNLDLCQVNSYPCDTFISLKILDKLVSYYMWLFNQGMELSLVLKKRN